MENYKNFFADSYIDEVYMEGNTVILTKKYADSLIFEFVDMGFKTQIIERVVKKETSLLHWLHADPSWCNSTNKQDSPIYQNYRNF